MFLKVQTQRNPHFLLKAMMHFISLPVSVNSGIATDKVANVTKHKVNKTSHVDTFPSAMMVV